MIQTVKILALGLLLLFAAQAPSYAVGLLGSDVNVSAYYPDLSTLYYDAGDRTVDGNVEYPLGTISGYFQSIDLSDTQIEVGFGTPVVFTGTSFNGFVITDLSGVFLSASYASGVMPDSISFVGNQLFLNYRNIFADLPNTIINVTTGAAAVPLPASLPLFAGGLAGLGWLARSRKRKAATAA
jgi:hypothetical protein